jgi:ABC-2 type transport system permease protein
VDAANNLAGLATMPLMFLSGMFFPLAALPAPVQVIADALPVTPLVEAMRAVSLHGAGVADVTPELLWLLGWVPVSFLLARLVFRMDTTPRPRRLRTRAGRTAPAETTA